METHRLSRIVNSILNFSKIEEGKREFNFSEIDFNNLIEDILTTYKYHLEKQGFKISFDKEKNIPAINADREALSEVIFNLIDNAVKYSVDNKNIKLKSYLNENFVCFQIEDNGIGISIREQKKIFEKFFRASTGLVHNTKGTGLGLTIAKHIIDAHNGKIEFSSESGKGSRFNILIPIDKKIQQDRNV
jgi:two-component system phosphate regulon sensor histidine kinase PhoR